MAFDTFRIPCAVRETEGGVKSISAQHEQVFEAAGLISAGWGAGRPVMVARNDVSLQISNGNVGIAPPDFVRSGGLRVYFLDRQPLNKRLRATRLAA